jgi:hypothetical protein
MRLVISLASMPLTSNASAINDRWHRHGRASAHISTTRSRLASSMQRARFSLNVEVCM